MKKVFTVLAIAAFVSFTACKNIPKNDDNNVVVEEVAVVDENEVLEEMIKAPSK